LTVDRRHHTIWRRIADVGQQLQILDANADAVEPLLAADEPGSGDEERG